VAIFGLLNLGLTLVNVKVKYRLLFFGWQGDGRI